MKSVTDQLHDLASLVQDGFLDREEFDQLKKRLLAGDPVPSSKSRAARGVQGGQTLGAYELLEKVGEGGMGIVFRARHRRSSLSQQQGGEVAIKIMSPHLVDRPEMVARFSQEAERGFLLDHPGIVPVIDYVESDGLAGIVMRFAPGRPLSESIGKGSKPHSWAQFWPVLEQILEAVDYAHGQGVIHRDLSPENVMLGPDGRIQVLDFGISKDEYSKYTHTLTGLGKIDYMAPEQYRDAKNVDVRADIYALGIMTYEALAGRLPWPEEQHEVQVMEAKFRGNFPPLDRVVSLVPSKVLALISDCLEPDGIHRPESVSRVLQVLREPHSSGVESAPRPRGTVVELRSSPSRPPARTTEVPLVRRLEQGLIDKEEYDTQMNQLLERLGRGVAESALDPESNAAAPEYLALEAAWDLQAGLIDERTFLERVKGHSTGESDLKRPEKSPKKPVEKKRQTDKVVVRPTVAVAVAKLPSRQAGQERIQRSLKRPKVDPKPRKMGFEIHDIEPRSGRRGVARVRHVVVDQDQVTVGRMDPATICLPFFPMAPIQLTMERRGDSVELRNNNELLRVFIERDVQRVEVSPQPCELCSGDVIRFSKGVYLVFHRV